MILQKDSSDHIFIHCKNDIFNGWENIKALLERRDELTRKGYAQQGNSIQENGKVEFHMFKDIHQERSE